MPAPWTPERLRASWHTFYEVSPDGCHEWKRTRYNTGYGKVTTMGKQTTAHRTAYELFVGPIPDGLVVRHRCRNRGCCNPDHLRLGTAADNSRDMIEDGMSTRALRGPGWPIFLRKLNQLGLTQRKLAKKFGVDQKTVSNIIHERYDYR